MKCGSCKENHNTVDEVVACYRKQFDKPLPARTQRYSRQPGKRGVRMASPKQISYAELLLKERPQARRPDKPLKELTFPEITTLIDGLKLMPSQVHVREWSAEPDITGTVPPDGRYTVVMPEGRRTIWFYSPRMGNFAGERIVRFLSGADNDSDYTAIGKVVEGGVQLWKKSSNSPEGLVVRAIGYLLNSTKEQWAEAGHTYALESSNCYRCGRTLTVPASIHRGLGPDCAEKVML